LSKFIVWPCLDRSWMLSAGAFGVQTASRFGQTPDRPIETKAPADKIPSTTTRFEEVDVEVEVEN
jgi:hypothetical protein